MLLLPQHAHPRLHRHHRATTAASHSKFRSHFRTFAFTTVRTEVHVRRTRSTCRSSTGTGFESHSGTFQRQFLTRHSEHHQRMTEGIRIEIPYFICPPAQCTDLYLGTVPVRVAGADAQNYHVSVNCGASSNTYQRERTADKSAADRAPAETPQTAHDQSRNPAVLL